LPASENPLTKSHAQLGLNIYLFGTDLVDQQFKLFVVQSRTGEIVESIPADVCTQQLCHIAVAQDGAVYMTHGTQVTKIK